MSATPLLDRINARKGTPPTPITERMSPFLRRLTEKRLDPKVLSNGAWTPTGSGDAA